jgi:hypothetical protein
VDGRFFSVARASAWSDPLNAAIWRSAGVVERRNIHRSRCLNVAAM